MYILPQFKKYVLFESEFLKYVQSTHSSGWTLQSPWAVKTHFKHINLQSSFVSSPDWLHSWLQLFALLQCHPASDPRLQLSLLGIDNRIPLAGFGFWDSPAQDSNSAYDPLHFWHYWQSLTCFLQPLNFEILQVGSSQKILTIFGTYLKITKCLSEVRI